MQLNPIGIEMSILILTAKICLYSTANIRIVLVSFVRGLEGGRENPLLI